MNASVRIAPVRSRYSAGLATGSGWKKQLSLPV